MIKKILLPMLMASLMFSIQISINACEDNNDSGPGTPGSADQFTASNDYKVNARIVGIDMGFGGLSTCADIQITQNGNIVQTALVMVNSDTIPYDSMLESYQTSLSTATSYDLSITNDGSLIASGSGVKPPGGIPTITNLDSGDVHQTNSDLTVEWGSVTDVTSWKVTTITGGNPSYESPLLSSDATSHVIPGTNFLSGGGTVYDVQVSAINGLYPGDDAAFSDPEVGYDIEGPKGYFIGLTQSDYIEIFVND